MDNGAYQRRLSSARVYWVMASLFFSKLTQLGSAVSTAVGSVTSSGPTAVAQPVDFTVSLRVRGTSSDLA